MQNKIVLLGHSRTRKETLKVSTVQIFKAKNSYWLMSKDILSIVHYPASTWMVAIANKLYNVLMMSPNNVIELICKFLVVKPCVIKLLQGNLFPIVQYSLLSISSSYGTWVLEVCSSRSGKKIQNVIKNRTL